MKIGLALGSGAARGWAHIGVIKALEELGVKIDIVTGCSIGAYVGTALASGKLAPLEEWVKSLTEWQVLGLMGVGIRRGGLVSGQKVFNALQDNFSEKTFAELKIPLGIVATDLYSGKEVSFLEGEIIDGVRASCAIPGLFPPVRYKNSWLVDGGVVNPIPVNLCRMLGADIVIAINLNGEFRSEAVEVTTQENEKNQQKLISFFSRGQEQITQWFKSNGNGDKDELENDEQEDDDQEIEALADDEPEVDLDLEPEDEKISNEAIDEIDPKHASKSKVLTPSMIGVMAASLEILQVRVARSRLAGDPPDIVIEPQLKDFGMMEFYRAEELIEEGYNSVQRIAEQIKYQLGLD